MEAKISNDKYLKQSIRRAWAEGHALIYFPYYKTTKGKNKAPGGWNSTTKEGQTIYFQVKIPSLEGFNNERQPKTWSQGEHNRRRMRIVWGEGETKPCQD